MGRNYEQPATINASIGQARRAWIIERGKSLVEGININPNISEVIRESIDCYQEVLILFGEDWRDHLQVQSQPKWVDKILEKLDNLKVVSTPEQAEIIEEMAMDISEGMIE